MSAISLRNQRAISWCGPLYVGFQWILDPDNVDFDAQLEHWRERTVERFATRSA